MIDIPEGHWSEVAAYELVRLGVTKGFPDGTFRGEKKLNRYETASFLARFTKAINLQQAKNKKILEEFKSEVAWLEYKKMQADKAAHRIVFLLVLFALPLLL